jgi:hypothetical protein
MSTPFGPQLIGETEKTLNALLRRCLQDTGLTEPEWVTLRVAGQLEGRVSADDLTAAVADRAHFADAADLVAGLTNRGLIEDGLLTPHGRALTASVQATITREAGPIWDNLPAEDVAAATRVLNEVVSRARVALG